MTGHCLPLKGPVQASIGVESMKEELLVFIINIEDPCLLGMDYLTQCDANLDIRRQTLRVQVEEVPLLPSGDTGRACGLCGSAAHGHTSD